MEVSKGVRPLPLHPHLPVNSTFLLGEITVSELALKALGRTPFDLVARHAVREHGSISLRERVRNNASYNTCGQIMSRYRIDPTDAKTKHVLVITRVGGGETVVCLESEANHLDPPCSLSS
jgi:hypothetical protein